jgi:hypothetical protein
LLLLDLINYVSRPRTFHRDFLGSGPFDKTYNSSMFWPTFQPGVKIFDAVANKVREVPGGSRAQPSDLKRSVVTPTPVQATPPGDWTAFGSVTAFLVGVTILIMGGVLWRRQR